MIRDRRLGDDPGIPANIPSPQLSDYVTVPEAVAISSATTISPTLLYIGAGLLLIFLLESRRR